jgi:5'-methylthioadenosine phosphorylase
MSTALIGFIGGTGVYSAPGITDVETVEIDTPFGKPVDPITLGTLEGVRCAFVARHGRGHRVTPTEVPYRAHIYALKQLGVKYIVAVSACGSLKEALHPGDFVVVDQFVDKTIKRDSTFYGNGVVVHVQMGDPVCTTLAGLVAHAIKTSCAGITCHVGGTYIGMEGPQFSSRAESEINRAQGGSVIGMTAVTEAKLAKEAEIAYSVVGLVTDYDCWHTEEVSAQSVIETMKKNGDNVQKFLPTVAKLIAEQLPASRSHDALKEGLMTPSDQIPAETKKKCHHLLVRYL